MPARIVELPTLVSPKLAFTLQFAANQAKQNTAARLAVSRVESLSCVAGSRIESGGEYIGGRGWTVWEGVIGC